MTRIQVGRVSTLLSALKSLKHCFCVCVCVLFVCVCVCVRVWFACVRACVSVCVCVLRFVCVSYAFGVSLGRHLFLLA